MCVTEASSFYVFVLNYQHSSIFIKIALCDNKIQSKCWSRYLPISRVLVYNYYLFEAANINHKLIFNELKAKICDLKKKFLDKISFCRGRKKHSIKKETFPLSKLFCIRISCFDCNLQP